MIIREMSEHESKKKRCPLFHPGGEFNPYKKSHNRRVAVVLFCGRVLSEGGDSSCTQVLRFDPVVVLPSSHCARGLCGQQGAKSRHSSHLQFTKSTSSYVVVLSQQQKKEHGDVSRPLNFPEFGASVHSAMKACRSVMWIGSWVWCLMVS